jgi:hypothetical protein
MSANRILLVCAYHPSIEEALLLADRPDASGQYSAAMPKRADEWFAKHARCSRGSDHFKLAFHRPLDWDVSPPAEKTVAGGVKLALVNGSKDA